MIDERAAEVRKLLDRVLLWAKQRPDVRAVGLVGSWARGEARVDSDVDLILLTRGKRRYLDDESWTRELGGCRIVKTRQWGPTTERRFVLPSGLEVETGIAPLSWAATGDTDSGTYRIVRDGMIAIYDPDSLLAHLCATCSRNHAQHARPEKDAGSLKSHLPRPEACASDQQHESGDEERSDHERIQQDPECHGEAHLKEVLERDEREQGE